MKALNPPPLASFILKVAGIILILLYLLDGAVLLSAARFQDNQWLLALTTQLVDRGYIPLLGMAALFTGFWVESSHSSDSGESAPGLKLAALLLASVLSAIFLILVPLHISTTNAAADAEVKRISDEATNAEKQLDSQIQQQLDDKINGLGQAIKSGQVPADQLAQAQQQQEKFKKMKTDPKELEAQIGPQRNQKLGEIRSRKQELETQVRDNSLRVGMRTSLGSLLLAVAYALIGWTGLRRLLNQRTSVS